MVVNGDTTVSVLLNTTPLGSATATFAAQTTFTVGTTPASAALGDINGDGRPDITTANFTTNNVSVLLNTTPAGATTATFAAQQTFAAGTNPNGAVVIDVTGDGRPDVVVTNSAAATVSVLVNNLAPYAVGYAAVVADQDRSGLSRFDRLTGAFVPLGPGHLDKVAAGPNGSFVANYPGFGVWLYRPTTGFVQINGFDAAALAMDPNGNVFVSFVGFGTFRFLLAPCQYETLDARVATQLAADGQGNVAANFPGAGVWLKRGTVPFAQINGIDARALAVDFYGNVVVSFNGFGTFKFSLATGTFTQLGTVAATVLAVRGG